MKHAIRNTQYVILITLILAWLILPQAAQAAFPVADDQALSVNEDISINITLTASDPDGDTLTYAIVTSPSHGSLTGTAPNLTYKPSTNYNGTDAFTFKANDGTSDSNIATISLTITPVDDKPVFSSSMPAILTFAIKLEEGTVTKTYNSRITEVDGDTLIYTVQNLPSFATLDSNTGEITLTITHTNLGTYSGIVLRVTDVTPAQLYNTKTVSIVIREAAIYYCDLNGNSATGDGSSESPWGTLQSVVEAGLFNGVKIISGDTLRLRTGFHGIFNLDSGAPSGTIKKNTDYITIEADTGAVADVSFIWLYRCEYWHFKGLRVSPSFSNQVTKEQKDATGGTIVKDKSGSNHIIVEDCNIFTTSADIFSTWDPYERHDLAYSGISMPYPTHLTIHGNSIHNVANGIAAGGSAENPGNYNLIEQNTIDSFGDDGIKTSVAHSIIQDNIITNVYKMLWYIKADGTPEWTHSDGIQLLTLAYPTIHDVIIRRNYINARTDPNRDPDFETLNNHALQATFLDGLVNGVIENNIIMGGHYTRGISINSYADNVRIVNNTLLRPYGFPTNTNPVISLPVGSADQHKWGARNVIVRNNIAHGFPLDSNERTSHPYSDHYENVVVDHNFDMRNYDPLVEFVDYQNGNVHLAAGSHFIDAGSSADAPAEDLERNLRPQGQGYDVGAYEYGTSTTFLLYGDVNNDKEITAYDAALAARLAVGLDELTADKLKVADVNGDSEVTAYDAALIAQKAVGLIEKFPVE